MRAVQDQIEVDDTRRVACRAATSEAGLNSLQRIEKSAWLKIGVAGNYGVQVLWRRRIDRLGFDERADADYMHDLPQLIDCATEKERAIAEV
jgi:hypothetical protein